MYCGMYLSMFMLWEGNTMNKFLCALVALLCLCSCLACGLAQATPGTYQAEAQGNNGPVKVEVVMDETGIASVTVTGHEETPGLSDPALERIPEAIVANQSIAVDTVSGATNTSAAIIKAVEDCLVQAGADLEAYKAEVEQAAGDEVTEEVETSVLVIGAGGSGMSAAITLQEQGVDVLLVEKNASAGGATALTGALINGGMSEQQKQRGVTDDVTTMFMDMMEYGSFLNDARMAWLMVNHCGEAVDWLHDTVGVEFEEALNYFPEHTNDRAFYPKGKEPGYLTRTMESYYLENGGEIRYETRATELIYEDGAVKGAICETPEGKLIVHADATILATGGYGASVELRPEDQTSILFYGYSGSTGDGIKMAEAIGAKVHYMEYLKSYPQGIEKPLEGGNISEDGMVFKANAYISPLASQAATLSDGAIYVNKSGERCMNENLDFVSIKKATMQQEGLEVFLVLNQKGYDNWIASMKTSAGLTDEIVSEWLQCEDDSSAPVFRTGSTLEEVAAKAGIDGATLAETVSHFNEMVAAGEDTDFGRAEMDVALDDDGAWYIIEQRLRMATSLGGLKTDTDFCVFDTEENPIPGLYACGETIGGVHGDESMPSNCVSWAITSGRLAGASAAEAVNP